MGIPYSPARRPRAGLLQLLTGAGAAILFNLSGTTGAYALSVELFEHFLECKILLLTAPEDHASQCLPNRVPLSFGTLAPGQAGGPPQIKDEEADQVEEEKCVDSEECCEFGDSFCEPA